MQTSRTPAIRRLAGVVGHGVGASVGYDPKRQMDGDLARLKTTIETGRPLRDAAARD